MREAQLAGDGAAHRQCDILYKCSTTEVLCRSSGGVALKKGFVQCSDAAACITVATCVAAQGPDTTHVLGKMRQQHCSADDCCKGEGHIHTCGVPHVKCCTVLTAGHQSFTVAAGARKVTSGSCAVLSALQAWAPRSFCSHHPGSGVSGHQRTVGE